ncbi:MAG: response regulator [Thermodesulfobacteriota bacterium]
MPLKLKPLRVGGLWPLVAAALALLGLLTAWRIYDDHRRTLHTAQDSLQSMARIADEQISGGLRAVDLLLSDVAYEWQSHARGDTAYIINYIKARKAALPEVRVIAITDRHGRILATNLPKIMGKDVSRREYFLAPHKALRPGALFLLPPVLTTVGTKVLFASRMISDQQGGFQGVISASLSPAYFQEILASAIPGDYMEVMLTDLRGTVLAAAAAGRRLKGRSLAGESYFLRHRAARRRVTLHSGPLAGDPRERLLVLRSLRLPSLLVVAHKPMEEVLSPWRRSNVYKIGTYLLVVAVTIFLLTVARRRWRRLRSAELALAEALALNRSIVSQSQVGIALFRSDGVCLLANQALADLLGLPLSQAQAQNLYRQPFWRESGLSRAADKTLASGRTREMEPPAAPGAPWLHWQISRIQHQGRPHLLLLVSDISRRKRAEQDKAHLEEQLRQAQKMEAVGTLAGGVAHDFNNILTAIIGYSELALAANQRRQDCAAELGGLIKAARQASGLVRQILTFSRKLEPELKPLDLNQEIGQTLEVLKHTLPATVTVETRLQPELPPVNADATQIGLALLNLASNAADAMPAGGRLLLATRSVELDADYCIRHLEARPGPHVMLEVSDNGQGMDRETQEHIFEPFFTTKEPGRGTGLGLATVYGVIKSHGGHILCHSQPGQGTTFQIFLPVGSAPALPPSASPAAPAGQAALGGQETILVVDDEIPLRELSQRLLAAAGYTVLSAASGEEALALYRQQPGRIGLVLLDLNMPGMGGFKCLREMLALDPGAKVLVASGYAADGQAKAVLEAGAAGFVAKPFRWRDLLAQVRQVLDRKAAPKQ